MTDGATGGNERIADRLARIETKLDIYLERQACLDADVAALKLRAGEMQTTLTTHSDEINRLRAADRTGNIVTGAMAVLAGVIGAWFKP